MPVATRPYVPALKWKQGEHLPVKPLTGTQKSRVLPIAELRDRPFDWAKSKYNKSWDKHIEDGVSATDTKARYQP